MAQRGVNCNFIYSVRTPYSVPRCSKPYQDGLGSTAKYGVQLGDVSLPANGLGICLQCLLIRQGTLASSSR